jgi:hypothetical protein
MLPLHMINSRTAQLHAYSGAIHASSKFRSSRRVVVWDSACTVRMREVVGGSIGPFSFSCAKDYVIGSRLFACKRFSEWLKELLT